jgi:hypothetical protein
MDSAYSIWPEYRAVQSRVPPGRSGVPAGDLPILGESARTLDGHIVKSAVGVTRCATLDSDPGNKSASGDLQRADGRRLWLEAVKLGTRYSLALPE